MVQMEAVPEEVKKLGFTATVNKPTELLARQVAPIMGSKNYFDNLMGLKG
jgi:hypothetical protein